MRISGLLLCVIFILSGVTACTEETAVTPTASRTMPSDSTSSSTPILSIHPDESDCSALVVYMDYPYPGEDQKDYTRDTIVITGYVNYPEASVKVNGVEATVTNEGIYSATLQFHEGSNSIQAVARLGEKTDEITYAVMVHPNGKLSPVPGLGSGGPRYQRQLTYENSLELKAGETIATIITLEIRKNIREAEEFSYTINRVAGEYSENELKVPDEMGVNLEPSQFTVCPNTTYHSILTVSTTPDITTGEYWFLLEHDIGGRGGGSGWIKIKVSS